MTQTKTIAITALLCTTLVETGSSAIAQNAQRADPMSSCHLHAEHARETAGGHYHRDGVNERGDAADTRSRDQICSHFATIAKAFADGRFDTPMVVQYRVPPGVPTMERRKVDIVYTYEQTEQGAMVRR